MKTFTIILFAAILLISCKESQVKDKDLSEICSNCTNDIIEEYYDSASMAAGYFRSAYKNSNLKSFKYYLNKADSIKWDLKRKIGCYDN